MCIVQNLFWEIKIWCYYWNTFPQAWYAFNYINYFRNIRNMTIQVRTLWDIKIRCLLIVKAIPKISAWARCFFGDFRWLPRKILTELSPGGFNIQRLKISFLQSVKIVLKDVYNERVTYNIFTTGFCIVDRKKLQSPRTSNPMSLPMRKKPKTHDTEIIPMVWNKFTINCSNSVPR